MGEDKISTKTTNNTGKYITGALAIIVIGLLGFFGGMQYQKNQDNNLGTSRLARAGLSSSSYGQMGPGRRMRNGGLGQVTAISTTSITVNDIRQNQSKTYAITGDTKVTNAGQTAAVSDIKAGNTVIITTSSSDSTTAASIRIGGMMVGSTTQTN